MASLGRAALSLMCYQIVDGVHELRQKKPHYQLQNGYLFLVQIHFRCSYDKLKCYLSAYERSEAGTELFPSEILKE